MCNECIEKDKYEMKTIEELLKQHPENVIFEIADVAEYTGISKKSITEMLQKGKHFLGYAKIEYPCEKCNEPIFEGTWCYCCISELKKEIGKTSSIESVQNKTASRNNIYSRK